MVMENQETVIEKSLSFFFKVCGNPVYLYRAAQSTGILSVLDVEESTSYKRIVHL